MRHRALRTCAAPSKSHHWSHVLQTSYRFQNLESAQQYRVTAQLSKEFGGDTYLSQVLNTMIITGNSSGKLKRLNSKYLVGAERREASGMFWNELSGLNFHSQLKIIRPWKT